MAEHQRPDSWGRFADDRRWDREATDAAHQHVDRLRAAAERWLGVLALVIGLLPALGLGLAGDIDGIRDALNCAERWALAAAVVLALVSVAFASSAAFPRVSRLVAVDGWTYKQLTASEGARLQSRIAWSRRVAFVAAVIPLAIFLKILLR